MVSHSYHLAEFTNDNDLQGLDDIDTHTATLGEIEKDADPICAAQKPRWITLVKAALTREDGEYARAIIETGSYRG